jgi:tetratricopeptide (TPR) repeat protein
MQLNIVEGRYMMFKKIFPHVRAHTFEYLFGAIITLLALVYAIQNVSSTDLWMHLKAGEWIVQYRSIPHQDIFSYTFQGKGWIDFEWLFQAIIYFIYSFLHFKGLVVLQAVLVVLILFILYKNGTLFDRGERWMTCLALVLVLNVMKPQIVLRPQIFFLLFLSIYIYVLNLYYLRNKNYLYLLPIFQVIWANIHGSFVVGIMLAGIYFAISTMQLLWAHRNRINSVFTNKKFLVPFAVIIVLIAASLVNPYGYKIYDIPLQTAFAAEAKGFIEEWSPIPLKSLLTFSIDTLLWFKALFLLTLLTFIICKENLKNVGHVALFIIFSLMAFIHQRFAGALGVAMGSILIFNVLNMLGNKVSRKALKHTWKWSYVILALFFSFFIMGLQREYKNIELSVRKGYYPEGVTQFIKEHGIQGNMFNSFDYGGFLIWHLYPQVKVFIDGRVPTVYSEDFFWLHRQGLENKKAWKRLVDEYDVDIVLIDDKRDTGYRLFVKRLDDDPSWSLVACDDVAVLYLKNKPKFKKIIDRYRFKYFRPGDISLGYAMSEGNRDFLRKLVQELSIIEARYPGNFYIYHSLGLAYLLLDEPAQLENASANFKKALVLKPDSEFSHFNIGLVRMKLKRYKEAIAEYEEVTENPLAYYYIGMCYYEMGDFNQAIKFLAKYKKIVGDKAGKEVYDYLGLSYLNTFQPQKAVSCFLRASYLSEPDFQIYQNLGIAYFSLKDYEKAGQYFQEALNVRPHDIKTLYNLGVCFENLGKSKEALVFFKRVADLLTQSKEERDLIERAKRKIEQ